MKEFDVVSGGIKVGSFKINNSWFFVYDLDGNKIYTSNSDFWGFGSNIKRFEDWALEKLNK